MTVSYLPSPLLLAVISKAAVMTSTATVSPCAYTRACTSFCAPVRYLLRLTIPSAMPMEATQLPPTMLYRFWRPQSISRCVEDLEAAICSRVRSAASLYFSSGCRELSKERE